MGASRTASHRKKLNIQADFTEVSEAEQPHRPLISIPLTHVLHWDSVPNPDTPCGLCVLHVFAVANTRTRPVVWWRLVNPANPIFKGHIRAFGLSIAARLPCSPTPARHLKMPCCSFWTMGGQRYCPRRIARLPRIIRITQSSSTSHQRKNLRIVNKRFKNRIKHLKIVKILIIRRKSFTFRKNFAYYCSLDWHEKPTTEFESCVQILFNK